MLHNRKFVSLYVKLFNVVIKDFLSSGKIAEALSAKGTPLLQHNTNKCLKGIGMVHVGAEICLS